ncbi:MAG: hypothetical protein KDC53_02720 [Saprospiraceae bacterium]|nr:hypothetical protein [Saprospiraceae bacterium]
MKKFIASIITLSIPIFLIAQSDYTINEGVREMSQGAKNSFTMFIPNASTSIGEDILKKYLRQYKGKPKLDKKTNEWFSDDAKLETISQNTIDIYTKLEENLAAHVLEVTFWYDLGGAFLSSTDHPEQIAAATQFMNRYGDMVTEVLIEEELKMEEKKLKELESDLSKLVKENDDYHKKVDEAQALIDALNKDIQVNLNAQSAKQSNIDDQRKTIDTVNNRLNLYRTKI